MNHIYFTVGLSGCGKSYWCNTHAKEHDVILDSDMIRAELWGDANNQQQPNKVFNFMFQRACNALRAGHNVYYSQTGLSFKHRASFVKNIRAKFFPENVALHCVILIAPIEICKQRNSTRARHVPNEVIERQVRQFQVPVETEGWDTIEIIPTTNYNAEKYEIDLVDSITIFGSQENEHHALSLYQHCYQCLKNIGTSVSADMRHAAFFHDAGKIYTKTYWPQKDNNAHYPNHAEVGAYLVLLAGHSLYTAQLVGYHMLPYNTQAVPTWEKRLGDLWKAILVLHSADRSAH